MNEHGNSGSNAAIAVFAYRRPVHLERTLRSLKGCHGFDASSVTIFVDGPRDPGESGAVEETQRVAMRELGSSATYRFSGRNLGLSTSILGGVTEILGNSERVIVIEDDLDLSPQFLDFLNRALKEYSGVREVWQVSGHQYDVPALANEQCAAFMPFPTSWGWGTWRRVWEQMDPAASGWQSVLTDTRLRRRFNLENAYDYSRLLVEQMNGRRDSWAIRFYWSMFRAGGVCLFPPVSLVRNTGLDGSGTHGRGLIRRFERIVRSGPDGVPFLLPAQARVDPAAYRQVIKSIRAHNGGWLGRSVDWIRWVLS